MVDEGNNMDNNVVNEEDDEDDEGDPIEIADNDEDYNDILQN